MQECDVKNGPLVAIASKRTKVVLCAVAALIPYTFLVLALLVIHWAQPDKLRFEWSKPIGYIDWYRIMVPWVAIVLLIMWSWIRPGMEFAVFSDGLKLSIKRIAPGASIWRVRDQGFYSWNEVDHCRWSRYQPGVLTIHLKSVANQGAFGLFQELPAMVLDYRVPESYQAEVEAAIRACGKWAE